MPETHSARDWLRQLHILKVMVAELLEGEVPLPSQGGELTHAQVNLLRSIQMGCDEQEGWSLRKLARHMQVSLPAISKAIGKLTSIGLLEVQGDPSDGRKRRVAITAAGALALEHADRCRSERVEALLDLGARGRLSSWSAALADMNAVFAAVCATGSVPSMVCSCSEPSPLGLEHHELSCPVRRHWRHLEELRSAPD